MICLLILLSYVLIGTVVWANTKTEFPKDVRKHWWTLNVLIWPVICWQLLRETKA